jgi:hypothetical protein
MLMVEVRKTWLSLEGSASSLDFERADRIGEF